MTKRMDSFEHARRTREQDWTGFEYPKGARMPDRPWHISDQDGFFKLDVRRKLPNSKEIIEHLKRTGKLSFNTGDVVPDWSGKVDGILLNEARPDDPQYTISREDGRWNLCVNTGYSAPYGKKVRIGEHMVPQGYPMNEYSDHKLHIYDPIDYTITEIQFLVDAKSNPFLKAALGPINWLRSLFGKPKLTLGYQCHGVKQYSLSEPSYSAVGSSAANYPIAEPTHRYDDYLQGAMFLTTMSVVKPHATKFVYPATATDGKPEDPDCMDPNAMQMGYALRLTEEAFTVLKHDPSLGPQSQYIIANWYRRGIVCIDTSAHHSISLEPDVRWDQEDLGKLRDKLTLDMFDVWELV